MTLPALTTLTESFQTFQLDGHVQELPKRIQQYRNNLPKHAPPEQSLSPSCRDWVLDLDRLLPGEIEKPWDHVFGLVSLLANLMDCPEKSDAFLERIHVRNSLMAETDTCGHAIALFESLYRDGGELTQKIFEGRERKSHFIWGFHSRGLVWPMEMCFTTRAPRNRYRLVMVGIGANDGLRSYIKEISSISGMLRSGIWRKRGLMDYESLLERVILLNEAVDKEFMNPDHSPQDPWPFFFVG